MGSPSSRMLALLSLLQNGRDWSGEELAARLDAAPRTVRRDLERLRELGYPVQSRRGRGGHYRLVAGQAMPPLLLADDEAVAVAVGLRLLAASDERGDGDRTAADVRTADVRTGDRRPRDGRTGDGRPRDGRAGEGSTAAEGALRKLEQVLPPRLRHRLLAVAGSLQNAGRVSPAPDLDVLRDLGTAIEAHQDIRFTYTDRSGARTARRVEPNRQVVLGRRWYLVGWDRDRADWRTFRLERIADLTVPGTTFVPRELPEDAVTFVQASARAPITDIRAVVRFHASVTQVAERLIPEAGALEAIDDDHCRFVSAPDSWEWLAITLAMVGVPYTIDGPAELVARSRELAARIDSATRAPGSPPGSLGTLDA